MTMLSLEDRESYLTEIVNFAREKGNNPSEVQSLVIGGALILGCDLLADNISEIKDAIEEIAGSIRETIPDQEE